MDGLCSYIASYISVTKTYIVYFGSNWNIIELNHVGPPDIPLPILHHISGYSRVNII